MLDLLHPPQGEGEEEEADEGVEDPVVEACSM